MELRHLRYFVEVAETLNFSRAAERLKVAQPALSKQIRDLEDELGARLFQRTTTKVALTEIGHYFRQEVRRLLLHLDIAVSGAQQLAKGAMGTLRLGCDWRIPGLNLTAAVERFREKNPKIAVQIDEIPSFTHVAAVRDLTIDVGFVLSVMLTESQDLNLRPLCQLKVQVALPKSHRFASRSLIKLRELRDERWLVLDSESLPGARSIVSDILQYKPKYGIPVLSMPGMMVHVAAGHGVGLLAEQTVTLRDDAVVTIDTDSEPITLYSVSLASPASPLVGMFLASLRETSKH